MRWRIKTRRRLGDVICVSRANDESGVLPSAPHRRRRSARGDAGDNASRLPRATSAHRARARALALSRVTHSTSRLVSSLVTALSLKTSRSTTWSSAGEITPSPLQSISAKTSCMRSCLRRMCASSAVSAANAPESTARFMFCSNFLPSAVLAASSVVLPASAFFCFWRSWRTSTDGCVIETSRSASSAAEISPSPDLSASTNSVAILSPRSRTRASSWRSTCRRRGARRARGGERRP